MTADYATSFRIEPELLDGLQQVKERDGIPLSEQVRRALRMWLEAKDIPVPEPAARTRRGTPARGRARNRGRRQAE